MEVSKLNNLLKTINVATTDQLLVYSQCKEDDNAFGFMAFSAGFDICRYLTNEEYFEVKTGKVLKNTLTEFETQNLQETGIALALNGTFCTITNKALIDLCALLGMRGVMVSKPSSTRDAYIASLIKENMNFVYTKESHANIIGVSNKKWTPTKFFTIMNNNLELLCGREVFSKLKFDNGIELIYRYPSTNNIAPVICLRDKIHGSNKYCVELSYDINGFIVPIAGCAGGDINAFCEFVLQEYPRLTNRIPNFFKHVSFDFNIIEDDEELNTIKEFNITTVTELIKYAKCHQLSNEIVGQLIKTAF